MPNALTAASIERLKPDPAKRLEIPDGLLPGLYLVVQPSGVKSWAVRYRSEGRPRKHVLGRYPKLDLAGARREARAAFEAVSLGRDPGAEKIQERRAAVADPDQDLVVGAVESFIRRHVRVRTKARSGGEHLLRKHVLPRWGRKRLDSIKRGDVVALLDAIVDAGSPIAANRVLAVVRKFFNWCLERGLLESSPCAAVKPPTEEQSRDRVLTDNELRLAWLAASNAGAPFGPLVQLLILSAQRRDEVGGMTRAERVAPDLWSMTGARTKNGRPQDVPLSPEAIAVLDAVPAVQSAAGFIFTTSGDTPFSGFSKCKARLDAEMLALAGREALERGQNLGEVTIAPWRLHDLRRTAATGMARFGTPIHVVEAVLNHTSGTISGVAAIYNRHRYLDEKRAALEAWGAHVTGVVS